ncbi:hypothetical protein GA0070216_10156 [Micromonospora matsumotoense]|uniref:Uncharacterized protein n=1 Tax=Micromonospora matsumotoense TaxID=121616 RepID=A0A1C4TX47_9ACTN|nr:hypothetical protein GA0070216_10156 [Micromonospora matsumotoense]
MDAAYPDDRTAAVREAFRGKPPSPRAAPPLLPLSPVIKKFVSC